MKLFIDTITDAAWNLALEEVLVRDFPEAFFMLWRNAPAVIVGRNQNSFAEVNAEVAASRGIAVVRRLSGGGAVYHDLGNVNYTIADRRDESFTRPMADCARPMVEALRDFGIAAEFSGRNDIVVGGLKISGIARGAAGRRTLFHGTLLFDADLSVLSEVLNPDPEKIAARGIKSVRSRVMNIRELLPELDTEEFIRQLSSRLSAAAGISGASPIPDEFIAAASELADRKYRTREWNYGSPTPFSFRSRRRFGCGGVAVELEVESGRVQRASISGDFFGVRPVDELAARLVGCSFESAALKTAAIGMADIGEFIENLSPEEFAELFSGIA